MSNCSNPCSNVQREFGEGCYRSGDVLFTYCTPFSNLLNERNCGCGRNDDNNRRRDNDCDRRRDNDCDRRRDNDCDCRRNNSCGCRRDNDCNRRCNRSNSAFTGGDFGNCFY